MHLRNILTLDLYTTIYTSCIEITESLPWLGPLLYVVGTFNPSSICIPTICIEDDDGYMTIANCVGQPTPSLRVTHSAHARFIHGAPTRAAPRPPRSRPPRPAEGSVAVRKSIRTCAETPQQYTETTYTPARTPVVS